MVVTAVALSTNHSLLVKKHNVKANGTKKKKFAFGSDQTSELKEFPGVNTP